MRKQAVSRRWVRLGVVVGFLAAIAWLLSTQSDSRSNFKSNNSSTTSAPAMLTSAKTADPIALPEARDEKTPEVAPQTLIDPVFASFESWTKQYAGAAAEKKAELEPQGIALATQRRDALLNLMKADPQRALERSTSYGDRAQLPASIRAKLEVPIHSKGTLGVVVSLHFDNTQHRHNVATIDGEVYTAHVFGRRSNQIANTPVPLHGIAIGHDVALSEIPVRLLDADEAAVVLAAKTGKRYCPVSGREVSDDAAVAQSGGEYVYLCHSNHLNDLNQQILAQEGGAAGTLDAPIAQSAWTTGNKTVLYIIVRFTDQPTEPQTFADATTEMNTVSAWFNEVSYGLTSMSPTITPCFVMPQDTAYYVTNGDGVLMSDARAVAKANGFDYATYNLDTIRWNGGPGSYGGQAYVGARGCWLKSSSAGVAEHELGHNYGLWHSNYWNAPNDTVIGPGSNVEYGDPYDVMGAAGGGAQHYNAYEKNRLDWIPAANVNTVTANGTYRLYSFDTTFSASNMYALKTKKDATRDYWVDYRQKFTSNKWEISGIELRWNPYSSSTGSLLLDTTPSSPDGKNDAAVVIGRTFSDYISDVHFTPIAKGGTTPESMDVVINRGTWANDRPPVISISASTTTVAANATVGFTATASDPDGDALAYYWEFGDGNFGPNSNVASKSWSTVRDYVVRCTVSDMKGGTASASIVISVGAPTIRRITGTIHDNLGNPLADVLVNNGLTTGDSNYRFCYTTTDGTYSLVSVAATAYTITATKANWTLTQSFTNPITGPATSIDFVGTENLYKITGKVTTDGTTGLGAALVSNGIVTEPTDASGNFTLLNVQNGSYTLTATKPGYTLSPSGFVNPMSVEFADATGKNFSAAATTYTISGEITGVLAGTAVTVTDGYRTTTSFKSGNGASAKTLYNLFGVPAGTWTLRASLTGTSFSPNGWSNPLTIAASTSGKNFAADGTQTFAISGNITDMGSPLAGVSVSTGSSSGVTDNSGNYYVAGLANGTYTATPTKSGFTFTPANRSVTVSGAVVTGQNFATTNVDPPPTVATAANATPNLVFDFKTNLSVLGADNGGEAYLTYTWSAVGTPPGPVTYSVNSAHAAKNALATFTVPGTYTLRATIRDFNGGTATSDITINVIDPAGLPIVAFNAPSSSALESVTSVSLPVSLSTAYPQTVTVNYAVSGGSATGGGVDYTLAAGMLTFTSGVTTQNITFTVVNDSLDEANETVQITLSAATNAVIGGNSTHTYTITDDDPSPTVAFNATSSNGAESTTSVSMPVSLSAISGQPVTVNYAVSGGTASGSGVDFTLTSGTLTFAPGTTTKNISLTVVNDALNETNETIQVTLSSPVNATLGTNTVHTYTINDNDPAPSVGFSAAASSGLESVTAVNIPVDLSAASGQSVSVAYAVTGGTATGGGIDFTLASGTLTFAPGTTTKNIAVTVNNETLPETGETIVLTLSSPVNATLGTSTHTYTILNDDNTPPVAANATFDTIKNTVLTGQLSATDANNDPLTFTLVSNGTLGTANITVASNGAFTYSPNTGARGTDTFTFKSNDGHVDSNVATITVNINNGKPIANASKITALLSKPASGFVSASDPDGDALTFTVQSDATLGTFALDPATGDFTYTAQSAGQDTITFQVSDGQDTSAPATLTITIPPSITFGSGGVISTSITVGVPTVFNSGAGSGLDIIWDFGDGNTASGDPAIHTYQAAGNYTLRLTASDVNGQSETKEFALSVVEGGDSQTAVDTDGDGVSDANEISMGTNPLDAASVMKLPMTVSKIAGSTRVGAQGKDTCQISGFLPGIGDLKSLKGLTFRFNIGGADVPFTLDAMGRGKNAHGTLSLKLKPGKKNTKTRAVEFLGGPLSFKARMSGDFAAGWLAAGLDTTRSVKNAPLILPVDIYFSGSIYTAQVNALLTAVASKSGKFKK